MVDLNKIKRKLLTKFPFFGTILSNIQYESTTSIKVAATDSYTVYYNPEFFSKLTDKQILFLLSHEILHIAFDHIYRSEGKNQKIWNIAADAIINDILTKYDDLEFVEGGVKIKGASKLTTEQLYYKLLEEYNKKKEQLEQENQNQSGDNSSSTNSNSQSEDYNNNSNGSDKSNSKQKETENNNSKNDDKSSEESQKSIESTEEKIKNKDKESSDKSSNEQNSNKDESTNSSSASADKLTDDSNSQNGEDESVKDSSSQNGESESAKDSSSQNVKDKKLVDEKYKSLNQEEIKEALEKEINNHDMWEKAVEKKIKEEQKSNEKDDKKDLEKETGTKEKNRKKIEETVKEISKMKETEAIKNNNKMKRKKSKMITRQIVKQINTSSPSYTNEDRTVGKVGISKPIIDWRKVLREAIRYNVDWSYKNATIENGIVTPHIERFPIMETEILLDTSGSVSSELLKNFLRECKNIIKFSKIKVGCFDDVFYDFKELKTSDDIDDMKFSGGGGTNFTVAVDSFSRRATNKIIFTDGYSSMPKNSKGVIWIVYGDKDINPNGGKVIKMSEEQYNKLRYSIVKDKYKVLKK